MYNYNNLAKYEDLANKNKKILSVISLAKLIIFILFLIFTILFFTSNYNFLNLGLALGFLVVYIASIILTKGFYKDRIYYQNILLAYAKHEARRNGNVVNQKGFFDKGQEFKRRFSKLSLRDKYLLEDIDVFGKNSLFEHLTSAKSVLGRYKLADSLCHGNSDIVKLNDKIEELGNKEELVNLEASLAFNNIKQDILEDSYIENLGKKFTDKKKLFLGLIPLYLLMIVFIILIAISKISPYYIAIPIIINIYYATLFKDEINLLDINNLADSIKEEQNVLLYLSKQDLSFIDAKYDKAYFLKQLKDFKRLNTLWQVLSFKKNVVFKLLFNGLICFEGIYQIIFNKFQIKEERIREILEDTAKLELLASYANLVADYNSTISKDGSSLEFSDLSNILVKDCVANSYSYSKGTIITGSNMSGKTTFLRTIGEAILLHNACGITPASSFVSPNYKLYTALRIKDDLSMGVSSFYAEIEKIKEMIDDKEDIKKLALIDEIFKGTNTLDRVYGAKMLIKKLEELNYHFIISTHDFELCEVPTIINYHFSEQYSMDYKEISFDYTLKSDKSKSTNAIFLLKKSGIINE